jgi:hypothetical protein
MFTLEIADGSLKIFNGSTVILLYPKDACAINALALQQTNPYVEIYNKYLANNTSVFVQPLSSCEDSLSVPFDVASFIAFAEANLG